VARKRSPSRFVANCETQAVTALNYSASPVTIHLTVYVLVCHHTVFPKQQKKVLLCSLLRYIGLNVYDLFTAKIECAQAVSVPPEGATCSSERKRKFCVLAEEGYDFKVSTTIL
jgi:hypothetical protein